MLELEDNLNTEIEFWRELINDRTRDCPQETLERMKQALALAERKLQLLRLNEMARFHENPFNRGQEH
ncbi:MAG: hypothetical protein V2I57_00245 [Xanthomonadales bacterium]|jgi:hypothetical protein|nr:hypothetical protein [Xanthomonadales bacterium]